MLFCIFIICFLFFLWQKTEPHLLSKLDKNIFRFIESFNKWRRFDSVAMCLRTFMCVCIGIYFNVLECNVLVFGTQGSSLYGKKLLLDSMPCIAWHFPIAVSFFIFLLVHVYKYVCVCMCLNVHMCSCCCCVVNNCQYLICQIVKSHTRLEQWNRSSWNNISKLFWTKFL